MKYAIVCDVRTLNITFSLLDQYAQRVSIIYSDVEKDSFIAIGDSIIPVHPAYKINFIESQSIDLCFVATTKNGPILKIFDAIGYPPEKVIDLDLAMLVHFSKAFSRLINSFPVVGQQARSFVTGLSYFKGGVDEAAFNHTILNLANHGQDLYFDYKIAERLLATPGTAFDFVIIGLGPYSLHFDMSTAANTRARVLMYLPILRDSHNYRLDIRPRIDALLAPSVYENAATASPCQTVVDANALFNKWNEGTMDVQKISGGRELGAKWNARSFPATVQENTETLRRYIALCLNKGIKVFLCTPPMSETYKSFSSPRIIEELVGVAHSLASTPGVYFRDFYSELNLPTDMFSDADHVNVHGAVAFSRALRDWIDGL